MRSAGARTLYTLSTLLLVGVATAYAGVAVTGEHNMLDVLNCHDKVVQDGVETLILPKEVESILGASNVDHFISNFGSKTPIWNSVAYFNDRYEFSLQVPIAIDYPGCKMLGAVNSAQVQINEVTKVEFSKSVCL